MSSIGIFKCDVCGKETRLDRTPHIERGSITLAGSDFSDLRTIAYQDTCSNCASVIYYGVIEIVGVLRKKQEEAVNGR